MLLVDCLQHPPGNAMLHAGGQGDAMLSAINLNPQDSEATLQVTLRFVEIISTHFTWTSPTKFLV